MSLDDRNKDEYLVTAHQIFQYFGADASTTLRVDALMEKFAPFVKTNKAEHSFLRSLLDPEHINPEITVSMLANSLNKYSESQKVKVDLDESFNIKTGQAPQDSDSGISTDGFLLLEELQCELREKAHLAQQLRTQLDYSDRHHEEALATVTADRDSLRAHLNMLREENLTLTHVRRDYEDVCERLCSSERALEDSRRELDTVRRRAKVLTEQVNYLENEKLTLQELLSKSKDECHRINDMYASRQSSLLEENETLRTEHADLSARLQDQEEFMQQIIKEKVLLEMELKDVLNKSNQTELRMERSIDVSYTEEQMRTALDSLNANSRLTQETRLLDEESFVKALKEDQGRPTNISLFDEIRLSFSNMSRHNMSDLNSTQPLEKYSQIIDEVTVATQTDELYCDKHKDQFHNLDCYIFVNRSTQTDEDFYNNSHIDKCCNANSNAATQTDTPNNSHNDKCCRINCNNSNAEMQTDDIHNNSHNEKCCQNNCSNSNAEMQTDETHNNSHTDKCYHINCNHSNNAMLTDDTNNNSINEKCFLINNSTTEIETDDTPNNSHNNNCCHINSNTSTGMQINYELNFNNNNSHELNFNHNKYFANDVKQQDDKSFGAKDYLSFIKHRKQIRSLSVPILKTLKRETNRIDTENRVSYSKDKSTNTSLVFEVKNIKVMHLGVQTDEMEAIVNNNNDEGCNECYKCLECERLKKYINNLENQVNNSNATVTEMRRILEQYEGNMNLVTRFIGEGNERNVSLKTILDSIKTKLDVLNGVCDSQRDRIEELYSPDIHTEREQISVSTQAEVPCEGCVKRNAPRRNLGRYFWEPLKSLFQLFAVLFFIGAIWLLCGVTRRWRVCRDPLPWRWLQPHDLIDLFLTIEYVSDVPM